mmetsp:Transcript_10952/g.25671  ORF Transcript_10952/g.25671 Transcript_10952/m.25671 type:complete len:284 (+) Transcript_10952:111-962(+)
MGDDGDLVEDQEEVVYLTVPASSSLWDDLAGWGVVLICWGLFVALFRCGNRLVVMAWFARRRQLYCNIFFCVLKLGWLAAVFWPNLHFVRVVYNTNRKQPWRPSVASLCIRPNHLCGRLHGICAHVAFNEICGSYIRPHVKKNPTSLRRLSKCLVLARLDCCCSGNLFLWMWGPRVWAAQFARAETNSPPDVPAVEPRPSSGVSRSRCFANLFGHSHEEEPLLPRPSGVEISSLSRSNSEARVTSDAEGQKSTGGRDTCFSSMSMSPKKGGKSRKKVKNSDYL